MSLDRDSFFIDGGWAAPATSATLQVVSPHSEQVVATVPEGSNADVDAAVAAVAERFGQRLAEHQPGVLDGVVTARLQVALGGEPPVHGVEGIHRREQSDHETPRELDAP